MDRNAYVTKLKEIHYDLLGLAGEATTADGEEVDDENNDQLAVIIDHLDNLIAQVDG